LCRILFVEFPILLKQAILAGALSETIQLVEVEETPLAYHPENATRLKVEVVGKMK